jgi:hypothetical protein
MDSKSEELLRDYKKSVQKLARGLYLQAIALRKELDHSAANQEDKDEILMHCINLITKKDPTT